MITKSEIIHLHELNTKVIEEISISIDLVEDVINDKNPLQAYNTLMFKQIPIINTAADLYYDYYQSLLKKVED